MSLHSKTTIISGAGALTSTVNSFSNEDSDFFGNQKNLRNTKKYILENVLLIDYLRLYWTNWGELLFVLIYFFRANGKKGTGKVKMCKNYILKKCLFSMTKQLLAKLMSRSSNTVDHH